MSLPRSTWSLSPRKSLKETSWQQRPAPKSLLNHNMVMHWTQGQQTLACLQQLAPFLLLLCLVSYQFNIHSHPLVFLPLPPSPTPHLLPPPDLHCLIWFKSHQTRDPSTLSTAMLADAVSTARRENGCSANARGTLPRW